MNKHEFVCLYNSRESEMTPLGFQERPLDLILEIDKDGRIIGLEEHSGYYMVPLQPKVSSNWYATCGIMCALVTHVMPVKEYLPIDSKSPENPLRPGIVITKSNERACYAARAHETFRKIFDEAFPDKTIDEGVLAVSRFLERGEFEKQLVGAGIDPREIFRDKADKSKGENWRMGGNKRIAFRLSGDSVTIPERDAVRERIVEMNYQTGPEDEIVCSITGELDTLQKLHDNISGLPFRNGAGGTLISSNQKLSHGDGRQYAYIGNRTAQKIYNAIQFLRRSKRNRFFMGEHTLMWWSENSDSEVEEVFAGFVLGQSRDADEDNLKNKFMSVFGGKSRGAGSDAYFHFMGISPSGIGYRAAIPFHYKIKESEIVENLSRFTEQAVSLKNGFRFGVRSLVRTQWSKKQLDESVMGATLQKVLSSLILDKPMESSYIGRILGRIRANNGVTSEEAAALRFFYNHEVRHGHYNAKEIRVMTDSQNHFLRFDLSHSPSYLIGGILRLAEAIQKSSNNPKAGIGVKYFRSMMSNPKMAFGLVMQCANTHVKQLLKNPDTMGLGMRYQKMLNEVCGNLEARDFPDYMSDMEKVEFSLGYHHMEADIYTSNKQKKELQKVV